MEGRDTEAAGLDREWETEWEWQNGMECLGGLPHGIWVFILCVCVCVCASFGVNTRATAAKAGISELLECYWSLARQRHETTAADLNLARY